MKHLRNLTILLICLFVIVIIYCSFTDTMKLHESISVSDVESINIWGHTSRMANSDEKQDIVKWFNSITNVRENKDFAGTTPESGIIIKVKNGNEILILKSGTDFEVQRINSLGKRISYWGNQSNIRYILYSN